MHDSPEIRLVVKLGSVLIVILSGVFALAIVLLPEQFLLLLAVYLVAVSLVVFTLYRWLKLVNEKLAAIHELLKATGTGQSEYSLVQNDEGLFSKIHNELYRYRRQSEVQAVNLKQDRQQLTYAITNIAHQLRTPIATSGNMIDLLTPENLAESKKGLQQQNERLAGLVEQMVLLAKVDTHTLSNIKEPVNLNQLLTESLNFLLPAITTADLSFDYAVPQDIVVAVNRKLMQEALINIFKNNFEHAPKHSLIKVKAVQTPLSVILTIENAGEAIAETDLPHLFDRFYRGSQSAPNNMGIGLSIAKGIITATGGNVSVQNIAAGVSYRVDLFR